MTSTHDEFPFRTMLKSWLSLMIPMAWMTWRQTTSLSMTMGAFLAPPLFAILQGSLGILTYRVMYGDAPLPHSPAHGVVVVNPHDSNESTISVSCNNREHLGCGCLGGRRWRNTDRISDEERLVLKRALEEPPLRLLVIGDSLAIGVGTSASCTPLLPEVIARTLSKSLHGRAVYWTCHGAPGASAAWIVRELERGVGSNTNGSTQYYTSDVSETDLSEDESSSESEEEETTDIPKEWQEWKDRLHRHRKRFDPDVLGPYDICVVLTGSNDLKSAFFPFLLQGEDVLFRKQAKERGGSYAMELRRVLDVLQQRMKEGMEDLQQRMKEGMEDIRERLHSRDLSPRMSSKTLGSKDEDDNGSTNNKDAATTRPVKKTKRGPVIVLPGMPARALPIFRQLPLRWLAVPIVDMMDNHKRALARSHPEEVIFVDPPTLHGITEFEHQRGAIWNQRETEDTLLALRDIHKSTCLKIERDMRNYYAQKGGASMEPCKTSTMPQHNAPIPPLSERPGQAGSKIFSVDRVHPNDEGYDYWGRYIATAIVGECDFR